MTAPAEHGAGWPADALPTEELARRAGMRPITSVGELADPEAFESDDEVAAFLADVYASRRANVG